MPSKHYSPLMWTGRDDDAPSIAEIQLDVLASFPDLLLPRPNDSVPVDPNDGYGDDDDAEDDAELGRRVQAVPGIVGARRAVGVSNLMLSSRASWLDVGSKRWHALWSTLVCLLVRRVWAAGWLV